MTETKRRIDIEPLGGYESPHLFCNLTLREERQTRINFRGESIKRSYKSSNIALTRDEAVDVMLKLKNLLGGG